MVCCYKDRGAVSTGAVPQLQSVVRSVGGEKDVKTSTRPIRAHFTYQAFLPYLPPPLLQANSGDEQQAGVDDHHIRGLFLLRRKIQARTFASIKVETVKTVTSVHPAC
jgi:hypothetical protein